MKRYLNLNDRYLEKRTLSRRVSSTALNYAKPQLRARESQREREREREEGEEGAIWRGKKRER